MAIILGAADLAGTSNIVGRGFNPAGPVVVQEKLFQASISPINYVLDAAPGAGHLLVVQIATINATTTTWGAAPTGWTKVAEHNRAVAYWRISDGSEQTGPNFTYTSSAQLRAIIVELAGMNTTPFDTEGYVEYTTNTSVAVTASTNMAVNNEFALALVNQNGTNGDSAALTNSFHLVTPQSDRRVVGDRVYSGSGSGVAATTTASWATSRVGQALITTWKPATGGAATVERAAALAGTAEIAVPTFEIIGVYPYKVKNLVATPYSATQINLSWDDVTALGGETFDIERNGVVVREDYAGSHTPASPYPDTGLVPNTPYTYRVRAVGGIVGGGALLTRQAALAGTANVVSAGVGVPPGGTIFTRQAALAGTAVVAGRGEVPGAAPFPTRAEALARANVVVVSGTLTTQYKVVTPPDDTTYDFRNLTSTAYPSTADPLTFGGASYSAPTPGLRTVVIGGTVIGQQSRDWTWEQVHDGIGGEALKIGVLDYAVSYDLRADNQNDGFKMLSPTNPADGQYLIEGAYLTWIRDDAFEADNEFSGTIRDCLVDGYSNCMSLCQSALNAQAVHTIEDCIFITAIMNNGHAADGAGHQSLFKNDPAGIVNMNNVKMGMYENPITPSRIAYNGGTGGVWTNVTYYLGPGWVGADPTNIPPGVTVSRNWQELLDAAVTWKTEHGY